MVLVAADCGQMVDEISWTVDHGAVPRVRKNSHEPIFGERTCGPAVRMVIGEPVVRHLVVRVVLLEERHQEIDIEQSNAAHSSSAC